MQGGLCQHQRRQKPDGTAGAKHLTHLYEHGQYAQKCFIEGDRAKLHDVGCHIIHNACCAAGQIATGSDRPNTGDGKAYGTTGCPGRSSSGVYCT